MGAELQVGWRRMAAAATTVEAAPCLVVEKILRQKPVLAELRSVWGLAARSRGMPGHREVRKRGPAHAKGARLRHRITRAGGRDEVSLTSSKDAPAESRNRQQPLPTHRKVC
mgnify:FL=1